MLSNNILGLVFSNTNDSVMGELTGFRAMGSVPFFARYRLIDFVLSNMVNSGIGKVGVITHSSYQSLMDHLGTGASWDLSRKNNGLYILPPFGYGGTSAGGRYKNKIDSNYHNSNFIEKSEQEYVVISDCDVVCNIDLQKVMAAHKSGGADITVVYRKGRLPADMAEPLTLTLGKDQQVEKICYSPKNSDENTAYGLKMYVMSKKLLMELVDKSYSESDMDFERDILQSNVGKLNITGYEFTGYTAVINSIMSYYNAHMELMDTGLRSDLFNRERPIYTKVKDAMAARYGLDASVRGAIVADGCVIEGEVVNSVLFRDVRVGKNAKIRNSILMQGTRVKDNCLLTYVITDKDVTVADNNELKGSPMYPYYIQKNATLD